MNKKDAHEAQHRNFHKQLKQASEDVKWFSKALGGDGRLEEAMELWYVANPNKDIRDQFIPEPSECTDPTCGPCTDPNWYIY